MRPHIPLALLPFLAACLRVVPAFAGGFHLTDATIADLNAAFKAGTLTSEQLVSLYLRRIEAYDKQGPSINAVITLNPHALTTARALDVERRTKGPRSPIHGVPIVLKDNFDTFDLPTTAGSLLLKGLIPPDDAFVVNKLREAGAVILAKVNLNEFADRGYAPHGFSSLGGQTRNPHDPSKNPAGSSGGTGAAIAAAFAQFGLGTDTGGSIRMPSSVNGIVGLRPTHDLLSRDGIVPISHSFDTAGPMARSVYDVAVSLGLMTGVDAADDATKTSAGNSETDYTKFLQRGALKGVRIGVARDFFKGDDETDRVVESAVAKLKELGVVVVDPVNFPEYLLVASSAISLAVQRPEFKVHIAGYLATLKPGYPRTLADLVAKAEALGSAYTNPGKVVKWKEGLAAPELDDPAYLAAKHEGRAFIRAMVLATFARYQLDALVYPTSPRPAQPVERGASESGGGRTVLAKGFANVTGFPELIVPAGMTKDGLPVTISFFGTAFSEGRILGFGYDFEQATKARVLPKYTPALPDERIELASHK